MTLGILAPVTTQKDEINLFSLPKDLARKLKTGDKFIKPGASKTFHHEIENYEQTTIVNTSLPEKLAKYENLDQTKESLRNAIAKGVSAFKDSDIKTVEISNDFQDQETVSEAVVLSTWNYKEKERAKFPEFKNLNQRGKMIAETQNLARTLKETPANLMTPQIFVETIKKYANDWNLKNVEIIPRQRAWLEEQKMGSFLSVSNGSPEVPPILLEIHVNKPADENAVPEICMVGKGITFDAGGISIKGAKGMMDMRADMGGAATTAAATLGAARLVNTDKYFVCLTPLTENMPSGTATKPGDVVTAMNGKTICVNNTDAEGRLALADALCYADKVLKAKEIINAATLTGAMMVALGGGAAGVWSRSDQMWELLERCGRDTGDRVWRMPLYQLYVDQMKDCPIADLDNLGSASPAGGACTAAGFLSEFVENENWAHVDIAGVMANQKHVGYINAGMSGRPARTFLRYIEERLTNSDVIADEPVKI